MRPRPRALCILLGLFGSFLLGTTPAHAVEYRLLVASIFDAALMSFVSPPELLNGASGPGLERVEKGLDNGQIDLGAMPAGRPLVSVTADVAKAWGAVPVPSVLPARGDAGRWDEVRWQGNPGERSIWMIRALPMRVRNRSDASRSRGSGRSGNISPTSTRERNALPSCKCRSHLSRTTSRAATCGRNGSATASVWTAGLPRWSRAATMLSPRIRCT
jgi:hypothetical protein